MIWIFAFLLRGRVVWIKDFQGEAYKSIAYKNPFGMWCRVYWLWAVGHCVLLDDGTVDPRSGSSYIKEWRLS